MRAMERRGFLKLAALAGASTVAAPGLASARAPAHDTNGLLVDATRCVGCRGCEAACTEVNAQRPPDGCGAAEAFDAQRPLDTDRYTVVNRFEGPDGKARYAKVQCMHCLEPACASACLTRALEKTPEGPIVYHPERCMGCRYCMVACPFDIPKFEYSAAVPVIQKCQFCFARQKKGEKPACATVCPSGALTFGKRSELLGLARRRIHAEGSTYVPHIYGEHEAGGTSVLYIADTPFEKLGLPADVMARSYPELTEGALGLVPFVMTLWPPLLMGIHAFSKGRTPAAPPPEGARAPGEEHHG